jgi:predicted signal transduction protein with EAL and GGDEF domain
MTAEATAMHRWVLPVPGTPETPGGIAVLTGNPRIGGEEFALLLPETNEAAARIVAERLRDQLRECAPTVQGERLPITVSIGIASATGGMSGIEVLIKLADNALYEAKRSGRDRIEAASESAREKYEVVAAE